VEGKMTYDQVIADREARNKRIKDLGLDQEGKHVEVNGGEIRGNIVGVDLTVPTVKVCPDGTDIEVECDPLQTVVI
jgi:hypothetical protein